jgi:diaminohydroxyphosphoribosylaminopyrimidine deaminase/5-amino-6-(5-phosphoribosylamino)uracil reductase
MDSTMHSDDQHWMRVALGLAAKGQGHVEPNPMVGCVLVKDGVCIAQGYHQRWGEAHAEIEALRSLSSKGVAAGATAYVTLEPCCHHGKTPPCATALIDAKVRRVVVAMRDPFPQVDGGGIAQLREAGIDVSLDVMRDQAEALNAPYSKRIRSGIPWVIAKWAMTLDGRIATVDRESQWITGAESRNQVHRLRGRVDAIVVGTGTVIADDPMLNARLTHVEHDVAPAQRIAKRIVMCRQTVPPAGSKLIQTAAEIPTWLFVSPRVAPAELRSLEDAGAKGFRLDTDDGYQMMLQMLRHLGENQMTNVMIEGGAAILGSCLEAKTGRCLVDEYHLYIGARVFGGRLAPGPIAGQGVGSIGLTPKVSLQQVDRFEDDVRLIYRRAPDSAAAARQALGEPLFESQ